MISIKDLASMTGYSIATISRVINNSPNVSEKTRQKVDEAIRSTGYHPNFIGRSLRLSSSMKLLFLLPTIENTFYSDILKAAEEAASEAGYKIVIGVTQNDLDIEQSYIEMLRSRQVDGVVLANTSMDKHDLNRISETFPLALMAHHIDGANVSSVSINNLRAAQDATGYLISLGHRRIAMLSGCFYRNPCQEREDGFLSALRAAGLPSSQNSIIRTEFDFHSGMDSCRKLMSRPEPPTAIFCVADSIAIGAMRYLVENKLNKQISVMGFDNVIESEFFFNGMTTVNQPKAEIGRQSVRLLLDKIRDISAPPESVTLAHSIIERGSARALR